ncbi:hypothetical protein CMV_006923 [Castanea mollissima]|uniref:Uncharacterized protein n=1 Tax=Castanea mollissima TaxID=60419 RepID=A0A8J4RJ00_9ROSI|nr:hypothetical protein CMV_006923 [Castanea mollissima]
MTHSIDRICYLRKDSYIQKVKAGRQAKVNKLKSRGKVHKEKDSKQTKRNESNCSDEQKTKSSNLNPFTAQA